MFPATGPGGRSYRGLRPNQGDENASVRQPLFMQPPLGMTKEKLRMHPNAIDLTRGGGSGSGGIGILQRDLKPRGSLV